MGVDTPPERQVPGPVLLACLEHAGQADEIALAFQHNRIPGELALDLGHLAVEHRPAGVDQHDPVAQRLHLVHLVRGHQDAFACPALFLENLLDQARVHRVEAGEGLVHDNQLRIVQKRGDELGLLLHPLAQLLHLLRAVLPQIEPLQPLRQSCARDRLRHPFQCGEVDQGGL